MEPVYEFGQQVRVVRSSGAVEEWTVLGEIEDGNGVTRVKLISGEWVKHPSKRLVHAWQSGSMARNTAELDAEQPA